MRGCVEARSTWLAPLVEHSAGQMTIGYRGNIIVPDKRPTPCDEFGVPDPMGTIAAVLSVFKGYDDWQGEWDLHHFAWPRESYRRLDAKNKDEGHTASNFRGSPSLKWYLPRQLHEALHIVTDQPDINRISHGVMATIALREFRTRCLYDTAKTSNVLTMEELPEPDRDAIRWQNFQRKLEQMRNDDTVSATNADVLVALASVQDISSARRVLRPRARPRRFDRRLKVT